MGELRYLLLQARHDDDPMREQERSCFAARLAVKPEEIVCWDLLRGPPAFSVVAEHDCLMIGGSGDFLVSQRDLPQFSALLSLLEDVADAGHPTFASCFGFQCLVEALGGEIVYDPDNAEVGTYDLTLTEEGSTDALLGSLPTRFAAQMGRKDRARRLPPSAIHLASSSRSPYQAFRLADKPIWATQFHPELTGAENRERFVRYVNNYEAVVDVDLDAALARFGDSPHTEDVLRRFVDLVFTDRRSA